MRVLYVDWDPATRCYFAVTSQGSRITLKSSTEPDADAEASQLEADEMVHDEF